MKMLSLKYIIHNINYAHVRKAITMTIIMGKKKRDDSSSNSSDNSPPASSDNSPPPPPSDLPSIKLVRREAGLVRMGFIPNEWIESFFKRTGVTGFGTLCFTVTITLMSKEIYVITPDFYGGVSLAILFTYIIKNAGPATAEYLDHQIDKYIKSLTRSAKRRKMFTEMNIKNEEAAQISMEAQLVVVEAKRENVALQQEAAYRARLITAYRETVKRLDYALVREAAETSLARRSMSDWVVEEVRKGISEKIKKDALAYSIESLKSLAEQLEKLKEEYPKLDSVTRSDKTS